MVKIAYLQAENRRVDSIFGAMPMVRRGVIWAEAGDGWPPDGPGKAKIVIRAQREFYFQGANFEVPLRVGNCRLTPPPPSPSVATNYAPDGAPRASAPVNGDAPVAPICACSLVTREVAM